MTSRAEHIAQQRREKLDRIRARGIEPYPGSYQRSHTTQEAIALLKQYEATNPPPVVSTRNLTDGNPSASVAGRITARRNMGKITF